jgi:DNA-directed RNA polymerase subunit RPC12/RpoP
MKTELPKCSDCSKDTGTVYSIVSNDAYKETKFLCEECISKYKIIGINFKEQSEFVGKEGEVSIYQINGVKYVEVPCATCKNAPNMKIPYEVYEQNKEYYLKLLKDRNEKNSL